MEKICIKNKYGYNTIENANYGSRIIKYLEALGGINRKSYLGKSTLGIYYYINSHNTITHSLEVLKDYTQIDLDIIEPINDNLKECFERIIAKINEQKDIL
jgi:hypothetical protein